jgi:hypothetical protein
MVGKLFVIVGVVLVIVGVIITFFPKIGSLPRLPGDIYIKKDGFTFYFPWVTSLVISIIMSLIFYLFFRK